MKRLLLAALVVGASALALAQGLDPASINKPLGDSWPTYSGDYSGKRYSALTQINQKNVKTLTMAWTRRLVAGPGPSGPVSPDEPPVITGGEGDVVFGGATIVKGAVLSINGVLYVTAPDNVWALDANDGHLLWRYFWKTKGGTHIGNRGMGLWNNYLFLETPDNYLVSLDARTGEERWHKVIADFNQQYFSTMAPIVTHDARVGVGVLTPAAEADAPVRVEVPSIGADGPVRAGGVDGSGGLEIPGDAKELVWWKYGPTPGGPGSAVIAGHLDWKHVRGIFNRLADTKPGDAVTVTYADGSAHAFVVDTVELVDKPAVAMNGTFARDGAPVLRLVTCGGGFDTTARSYRDNVIVFADLA